MDVSFTHGNEIVKQAVLLYSAAIGFLLRSFDDQNRAQNAFEFVKQISNERKFTTCLEWIELSQ